MRVAGGIPARSAQRREVALRCSARLGAAAIAG
jgi:hypothetical protein